MPSGTSYYTTFAEISQAFDKNGMERRLFDTMLQGTDILDDFHVQPSSEATWDEYNLLADVPRGFVVALDEGTPAEEGGEVTIQEPQMLIAARGQIARRAFLHKANENAIKARKARRFYKGLPYTMVDNIFYGDTGTSQKEINGLLQRYNDTSATNGGQIILGDGDTADVQTSIWMVAHGPEHFYLHHPSEATRGADFAGLKYMDNGIVRDTDQYSNPIWNWEFEMEWYAGISIPDYRAVVRIANIEVQDLLADPTDTTLGNSNLPDLIQQGYQQLEDMGASHVSCFMHSDVLNALERQVLNVNKVRLTTNEVFGRRVRQIDDHITIRKTDILSQTEAIVS